jgi:hypothetical protein
MRSVRALSFALVSALVVLPACGGDDDTAATATTRPAATTTPRGAHTTTGAPSTAATTTTTTTGGPGAQCPPAGAPGEAVRGGDAATPATLTDVAIVADGCVDEVALTFSSTVPGYLVEYRPGPFSHAGSGEPVEVDGEAFVVIRLEPAYTFDFERGVPTYSGPRELVAHGTRLVREVDNAGDFEAVMTWIVGLERAAAVTVVEDGPRLVVTFGSRG